MFLFVVNIFFSFVRNNRLSRRLKILDQWSIIIDDGHTTNRNPDW